MFAVLLDYGTPSVQAAGRGARPAPPAMNAIQVASLEDQHAQAGIPPNLDWSIFLPSGDGQFQVSVFCSSCHSLKVTVARRSDSAGWQQIVRRMIDVHNAPIQPDDVTVIAKYLSDNLGTPAPALDLPLHINTASPETLKFLGAISPDAQKKILDARAKGKIKDMTELEAVSGDKNIAKYKSVLAFN